MAFESLVMNLSHIITEFSFGPYFPDMTQPLDYSYEVTHDRTFLSLSAPQINTDKLRFNSLRSLPIFPTRSPHHLRRPSVFSVTHASV